MVGMYWAAREESGSARGAPSSGGGRGGFGMEGVDGGRVLRVLRAPARALGGFVGEKGPVGPRGSRGVTPLRESFSPEHQAVQMSRSGGQNRVGFGEGTRGITARQVEDAQVVVPIEVEGGQLGIGAQLHRHEELDRVLYSPLRQIDHAVEEPAGPLLGRHAADIGRGARWGGE